jgi:hypothetical protein
MSDPLSFQILHCAAEYWNLLDFLLEMNRSAELVVQYISIAPDIPWLFDIFTSKCTIANGKF